MKCIQRPWSSLDKEELVYGLQNNFLIMFLNIIKKIALQNNISFCLMGKLSGKPVVSSLS